MALNGKVALVTGGGRGIGEATAIELAKAGADVAVADIDAGAAEEMSSAIRSLDRRSLAIRVDIGDLSDIDAMVGTVVSEFGGIDIVVNNAGVTRHGALLDITEETWDLMQRINAKGTFFCIQRVARQMVDQGRGGRIINISSTGGKGFRGGLLGKPAEGRQLRARCSVHDGVTPEFDSGGRGRVSIEGL